MFLGLVPCEGGVQCHQSPQRTQQIKQDARPAVLGSDHRAVPRHYLRVITTVGRAPDPGTSFMQSAAERMRAAERRDIGIVGRHQQHRIDGSPRRNLIKPSFSAAVVLAGEKTLLL